MFRKGLLLKLILSLIPLLFLFINFSYAQENNRNQDTVTLRTLHNELDTAGEWIEITKDQLDPDAELDEDEEGYIDSDVDILYVWRPHYTIIDPDWSPYWYGHWIWSGVGWTWISYYTWGWLPYHYGRWWFSPVWGWVWSPGYTWAPCWVNWYWDNGYCGWYPISPRHRWHWHNGGIVKRHHIFPNERNRHKWTFVKKEHFTKDITRSTIVNLREDNEILPKTKDLNGTKNFNKGPEVRDIEKSSGEKVKTKTVLLKDEKTKETKNLTVKNNKAVKEDNKKVTRKSDENSTKNKTVNKNTKNKNDNGNTKYKSENKSSNKSENSTKKKSENSTKNKSENKSKKSDNGSYNKKSPDNNKSNNSGNNKTYNPPTKSKDNSSHNKSSNNGSRSNNGSKSSNNGSKSSNNGSKSSNNGSKGNHRK